MVECLRGTLQVIASAYPNCNVVLKPHIITDMEVLHDVVKNCAKLNIMISYAHPGVIARFSTFTICNAYSTAMADAKEAGSITVEFSDYSQRALNLSMGESVEPKYIDFFVNRDLEKLKNLLNGKNRIKKRRFERPVNADHSYNSLCSFLERIS